MTNPIGSGKDLPLTVENTAFLLERLHEDCHELQFLRELTQNGIEAIEATGEGGEITWDVDWLSFDLADEPIFKLCMIDTGSGMTGPEQLLYINKLSSSIRRQSIDANYGIGAKIAALPQNPYGLMYLSWKDGEGTMIHLRKNQDTGEYGLEQFEREDGSFGHYLSIDSDVKPRQIDQHGTKVILLGKSSDADTMSAPEGVPSPSRWIAKYLNTRYYKFPDGVQVQAREGWTYPRDDGARNKLRTITGQYPYLENHAKSSGIVELQDAKAHWWILADTDAIGHDSNYYGSSGHVAALYRNELYEFAIARSGTARLQQFGVVFGHRLTVIYVEPDENGSKKLTTNTARTQLLLNNESLPWDDWAAEFRANMPEEIQQLIEEKAAASSGDHTEAIRDRLKPLLDLFRLSRYRPAPRGDLEIDKDRVVGGQAALTGKQRKPQGGRQSPSGSGGTVGNVYAAFQKKTGDPAEKTKTDPFPAVHWISNHDGSREAGDLEDRAARYLRDTNTLLINADFRIYRDTVAYWVKAYGESSFPVVEQVTREWIEQALVEAVLGVRGLEGSSREWNANDIDVALSEEALTTAIQQRYHIHTAVKRALGAKLGTLRGAAA